MSIPETVQAYLKGPSCPAPEGENSNLDNPPNSNGEAFFFAILFAVVVTTTTLARAYSRICLVKKLHIEDCMSTLQTFCVYCYTHKPYLSRSGHWCHSTFLKLGPISYRFLTLSDTLCRVHIRIFLLWTACRIFRATVGLAWLDPH